MRTNRTIEQAVKALADKSIRQRVVSGVVVSPYPANGTVMHVQLSDPALGDNLAVRARVLAGASVSALPVGTPVTVILDHGRSVVSGVGGAGGGSSAAGDPFFGGAYFKDNTSGDIVDLIIPNGRYLFNGGTTAVIHGIAGGVDGRLVTITNRGGGMLTPLLVLSESPTELTLPNRIRGHNGAAIAIFDDTTVAFIYDGDVSRWRPWPFITSAYQPFAYALGTNMDTVSTGNTALAAVSGGLAGARAIPILVTAPMWLKSYTIWNTDTASLRTADCDLFMDTGSNTFAEGLYGLGFASFSFTPSAASARTATLIGSRQPIMPGLYWFVIRNTSSTQTFGLGQVAAGSLAQNVARTTTTMANSWGTIDISGWTASTAQSLVRLNGSIGHASAVF